MVSSMRRGFLFGVLCLVLVAPVARAEDPPLEITIQEGMEISVLLQTVARVTGQAIAYDPKDKAIAGKTIMAPGNLKAPASEILALTRAILTFYDLVMIPVGPKNRQVLLVMDARQTQSILKLKPTWVEVNDKNVETLETQDGYFVTTLIRMQHLPDLRDARNALQRIVTPQNIGNIQEVPAANSFVVTDFAPNVAAVYRLLKVMDIPTSGRASRDEIRVIPLRHRPAREIALLLTKMLPPPPPMRAPPQGAVEDDRPRIEGDEGTNSVLLAGSTEWLDRLAGTLVTLDVPAKGSEPAGPSSTPSTRLEAKLVTLDVQDVALADVLESLRKATGEKFVITPAARVEDRHRTAITLHAQDVSAATLLQMVVDVAGLKWQVRGDAVLITDGRGR